MLFLVLGIELQTIDIGAGGHQSLALIAAIPVMDEFAAAGDDRR
jgi:hypothetical protein